MFQSNGMTAELIQSNGIVLSMFQSNGMTAELIQSNGMSAEYVSIHRHKSQQIQPPKVIDFLGVLAMKLNAFSIKIVTTVPLWQVV
jgi:hypothetical protein